MFSLANKAHILQSILQQPRYGITFVLIAWVIFTTAVWLPNLSLLRDVLFSGQLSWYESITFTVAAYGAIGTNFTILAASYTVLVALLVALQVVLTWHYIRIVRSPGRTVRTNSLGFGGMIAGFFGVGCAACGSLILTSVLSFFGVVSIIGFLPLAGQEFGVLAVVLLGYVCWQLLKKLEHPYVC